MADSAGAGRRAESDECPPTVPTHVVCFRWPPRLEAVGSGRPDRIRHRRGRVREDVRVARARPSKAATPTSLDAVLPYLPPPHEFSTDPSPKCSVCFTKCKVTFTVCRPRGQARPVAGGAGAIDALETALFPAPPPSGLPARDGLRPRGPGASSPATRQELAVDRVRESAPAPCDVT